jgi:hypothetical protein
VHPWAGRRWAIAIAIKYESGARRVDLRRRFIGFVLESPPTVAALRTRTPKSTAPKGELYCGCLMLS